MTVLDPRDPAAVAGHPEPARSRPVENPEGRRPARRPARATARAARVADPALAAAAGLALWLAAPPIGAWPLAPLGVAALAVAVRRGGLRRAYLLGLVAGLTQLVPVLSWARAPGVDLWLLLATFEAVLSALGATALALVRRLPWSPVWGSCVLVADEALRDRWPFGGFAWARLAFTQPGSPFTRWASLGGAPLVSFAVGLVGLLLARALCGWGRRGRSDARRARRLAGAAAALVVAAAGALVPIAGEGRATVRIAVVQGNVPRQGFDVFRQRRAVLADHVQQTLTLAARVHAGAAPRPDLVVWPEDADDVDPFEDRLADDEITAASAAVGAPVLLGAVLDTGRPAELANTALLFTPTGYGGQQYVKRRPVPFGEWLPYRALVEHLTGRARTLLPEDDVAGRVPGEFDVAGTRIGDVICFEVADDGVVRDAVTHGGRLLVVQTNNATFGRGGETWQQLAMARLRAVEHGRAVVVSSTSGVSALVDARGRVAARTGLFVPGVLESDVSVSSVRTTADRVGAWPDRAITTLGLVGVVLGALGAVRSRRRQGTTQMGSDR